MATEVTRMALPANKHLGPICAHRDRLGSGPPEIVPVAPIFTDDICPDLLPRIFPPLEDPDTPRLSFEEVFSHGQDRAVPTEGNTATRLRKRLCTPQVLADLDPFIVIEFIDSSIPESAAG